MVGLLALGVIVLLFGIYVARTNRRTQQDPRVQQVGKIGSIVGVVLILASVLAGSFTTVPAGHRGVVIRFAAVTGKIDVRDWQADSKLSHSSHSEA